MSLTERITNDYSTWTQGPKAWYIYGPSGNKHARGSSGVGDYSLHSYEIKKSFTVVASARQSSLTVWAEVYKADPDPDPGVTKYEGSAKGQVYLKKPDGTEQLLWEQDGSLTQQKVLDALDICSHVVEVGTYWLIFRGTVKSCWFFSLAGDSYFQSFVDFWTVSLQINDTAVSHELTFDEALGLQESFVTGITLVETLNLTEHFVCTKTTPLASEDEKIIAAKTDKKVYAFDVGTPEGVWDSDDLDFGLPNQDKTLSEVQVESQADTPHTVQVYISVNSGRIWSLFDQCLVGAGSIGSLFPWITSEKIRIRFKGIGLHLCSFTLWAIPRGTAVRT